MVWRDLFTESSILVWNDCESKLGLVLSPRLRCLARFGALRIVRMDMSIVIIWPMCPFWYCRRSGSLHMHGMFAI